MGSWPTHSFSLFSRMMDWWQRTLLQNEMRDTVKPETTNCLKLEIFTVSQTKDAIRGWSNCCNRYRIWAQSTQNRLSMTPRLRGRGLLVSTTMAYGNKIKYVWVDYWLEKRYENTKMEIHEWVSECKWDILVNLRLCQNFSMELMVGCISNWKMAENKNKITEAHRKK